MVGPLLLYQRLEALKAHFAELSSSSSIMKSLNYHRLSIGAIWSRCTTDAIVATLAKLEGVQLVVLYGSRAKHTHRYNSDIDLLLEGDNLGFQTRADAYRELYEL